MKNSTTMKLGVTGSIPASGKLKIFLLVIAFIIIGLTLWYTHGLVRDLNKKEKEIADLYARSLEYVANTKTGEEDYNFIFTEVLHTIDFPIVMTDPNNQPILPYRNTTRNVPLDMTLPLKTQQEFLQDLIAEMDGAHPPLKVTYQDTIILNYVHFGESALITKLRWLPYVEMAVAALFILIGYISFSYVKRSEQSSIWVGMARETAHQLGTPISSLLGWLELLRNRVTEKSSSTDTFYEMENDLLRLQKIVDRFSKIGSKPDLREESLREVISKVIEYYERRIPRLKKNSEPNNRIQLILEADETVRAPINRELFEWVLENLTKNALDALETGIGIISFVLSDAGRYIYIDVSDTGKGIDLKYRTDVFRPGFSTKKRGWGLGLSLAKRIIETYHHGKLFLKESKPGYKTTFRIKLKK